MVIVQLIEQVDQVVDLILICDVLVDRLRENAANSLSNLVG